MTFDPQQTKEVAQKALKYIEGEIKYKEMESNSVKTQTLQEIRKHSINFEKEKRRFDEQITILHEEQISKISDLRNRLAAMTHVNARDQF